LFSTFGLLPTQPAALSIATALLLSFHAAAVQYEACQTAMPPFPVTRQLHPNGIGIQPQHFIMHYPGLSIAYRSLRCSIYMNQLVFLISIHIHWSFIPTMPHKRVQMIEMHPNSGKIAIHRLPS
jgi:hypothetical protein